MKSEIKSLLVYSPAYYYGFTGNHNLGDEAIWHATEKYFQDVKLYAIQRTRFDFINNLLNRKNKRLVILGGGTLIGDNKNDGSNPFRENYSYFSQFAANKVVFGTGVGDIYGAVLPPAWLTDWKKLLSDCDYIGVRGNQSKTALKTLGIESEVIGDTACSWAMSRCHQGPQVKRKLMGINIGAREDLLPEDEMAVYSHFVKSKYNAGWEVWFFIINPSDYGLTKKFSEDCCIDNPNFITIYHDTTQYLDKVCKMHCFIGTRLHSVILAMCAGVPSIMIAYAAKAYDFMESIDMEEFNISMSDLTFEKLDKLFENLLSDKVAISKDIFTRIIMYKEIQEIRAKQIIANL